jgi:hypothetical protein
LIFQLFTSHAFHYTVCGRLMGPEMAAQSEFQESADSLTQNFGEPYFATKVGLSRNYGALFHPFPVMQFS